VSRAAPPFWDHQAYILRSLADAIERALVEVCPQGAQVIDLGCGDRPYDSLLAARGARTIACDLDGPCDVRIEPGKPVPLEAGAADLVVSFQVLEHVWDLGWYLGECRRLLKPSGRLLLSTHGTWLYHPHPTDFRRWTRDGLERELSGGGFAVERVQGLVGPLAWSTQFRLLGVREVLRRVPLVGDALVAPLATLMNLRMRAEDALTPPAIRDANACVYLTISRPA
jgi:SAM-dependent methyltransferase